MWDKRPEDLVQVLPKEILPSDFGGSLQTVAELNGTLD